MATAPPRVKLITIDGLFRQYDHRIPLRLDERVTVLHGRNGVGKTVTLSLVAALLRGNYARVAKVPFSRLRIDFTDGSFLSVGPDRKGVSQRGTKRGGSKRSELSDHDRTVEKFWIEYSAVENGQPKAASIGPFVDEVAATVDSVFANIEPPAVGELRRRVSVHFIEAQRLFNIATRSVTVAVTRIAQEMGARIKEADSTYRATSTRLDDSMPARLFAPPKNGSVLPKKELARRSEALESERRRLHEIGLLPDTTSFNPTALNDTQRAMFVVYLKDNEEKLAVFKDLADRAEILLGGLNRKLAPKHIQLDKDQGYKVTSHDGQPLDLCDLSSGEQHELVLLHNLLFRVEPGALLLIDEPELSLHVTWQNEFLGELIQIAKKVGFDAVVATHSPYIVGERRDLMVRLGEPV